MPVRTDSLTPLPAGRNPIPENSEAAISCVLWENCLAEAGAMWEELHGRLHPDESRKAAFIDFMARNLMNKTTRKHREQAFRQLLGSSRLPGHHAA